MEDQGGPSLMEELGKAPESIPSKVVVKSRRESREERTDLS